ncbi:MAG: hypothetical protein GF311_03330 [Candidatus Lokiarchaeota archaeon]|nr:hypothetical protein [Candidatus Lokiarchaeota archaeon]
MGCFPFWQHFRVELNHHTTGRDSNLIQHNINLCRETIYTPANQKYRDGRVFVLSLL